MIEVELKLQPEGEPQEIDGLLWGGKEPVQFDFDLNKPNRLVHENGVFILHPAGSSGFPESKPVEIVMFTSYPYVDDGELISERLDIVAATLAACPGQEWLAEGEPTLQMLKTACYKVCYHNGKDCYLAGFELIERAQRLSVEFEKVAAARRKGGKTCKVKDAFTKKALVANYKKRLGNQLPKTAAEGTARWAQERFGVKVHYRTIQNYSAEAEKVEK